jgi:hypothetical protein
MKKSNINLLITVFSLIAQGLCAYLAFVGQLGGMKNDTIGVSIGMFSCIFIFNVINTIFSFLSLRHRRTFPALVRFSSYLVSTIANGTFITSCIGSRLCHSNALVKGDDMFAIFILICGYALFARNGILKNGTIKKAMNNTEQFARLNAFTVCIAHGIFILHMVNNGTNGMEARYILLTFFGILARLIQNKFDIILAGPDDEKGGMLLGETWNLLTWTAAGVVFFLK